MFGLRMPREELPYGYHPEWDDGNEGHDYLAITESLDDGHTWDAPRPGPDGRIITAYYRTADPEDYLSTIVEGVIWDVPPQD